MPQTNVSIRVDAELKKDVEALFSELGLTLSSATNVFYRQALRTKGIPFPVVAIDPKDVDGGTLLREALREAQEQAKLNGNADMTLDEINNLILSIQQ